MPQVRGGKHGKSSPGERTGTLQKSEADDFLKFLFINVARRPAKLTMRECMRVARYLDWLARDGVPKAAVSKGLNAVKAHRGRLPSVEERDKKWCVKHIADLLWGRVRTMKVDEAASNQQALRFLRSHAQTHFANRHIERALELIQDFDVPAGELLPRPTPTLVSRSMSAFGGDPHLQSDLSERLFAAHHVLKRTGLYRTHRKIAKVVNACGVKPARRGRRDPGKLLWLPEDVHDGVKAFEKRLQRSFKAAGPRQLKDLVHAERDRIADQWIRAYRLRAELSLDEKVPK